MIDLILICFFLGIFYGGFWCGKKYGTVKAMATAATARFRAWLE